jgi:5'-3' exonuclease
MWGFSMAHLVLIDLSIIFRRHWHSTKNEPISTAMERTLDEVRLHADGGDHVAVCIDMPPYLRAELYPDYKAQREKPPQQMFGELDATITRLRQDGYLVVGARGFEADDIIATFAVRLAGEHTIAIISGDKDALQLVSDYVHVKMPATSSVFDVDAVRKKYGVPPESMVDWIALAGDKPDNIPHVAGIGEETATKWLQAYRNLDGVFAAAEKGELQPERLRKALLDSAAIPKTARQLVRLRADAPIDVQEIFAKRDVKPIETKTDTEPPPAAQEEDMPEPEIMHTQPVTVAEDEAPKRHQPAPVTERVLVKRTNGNGGAAFELALEPRNLDQAHWIAKVLYQARLFGDFPNVEAVLGTIMTGRSFGLDAVTSLRSFHNIKGKQTMSATLMIGLVKRRTDLCRYFTLIESSATRAVYETHRANEPAPTRMEYTIEEAKKAGLVTSGSNWDKRPKTMLRHRCATELARAVYPDLVAGLYSDDEMEDAR